MRPREIEGRDSHHRRDDEKLADEAGAAYEVAEIEQRRSGGRPAWFVASMQSVFSLVPINIALRSAATCVNAN